MTEISPVVVARTHLQHLRTRILIALDHEYPKRLHDAVLHTLESDSPGLNSIKRELHYLAEKGLVTLENHDGGSISAGITARGRDFVMGEFEEMGITPASDYGYAGK